MFGFNRDQWTNWIMGALITFMGGRALQWLTGTLSGLDWSAGVAKLSSPTVQATIAELLLPTLMLGLYALAHRGKLRFEPIAKITLCSMSSGYIAVFLFNLGRPNNELLTQLVQDPLSAFPIFFIPVFWLMHSVLKTVISNEV